MIKKFKFFLLVGGALGFLQMESLAMEGENFDEHWPLALRKQFSREIIEEIKNAYKFERTSLTLKESEIDGERATILADNPTLKTIKTLDLENNEAGDEGAAALAKNLVINWLVLTKNRIGNVGAEFLSLNSILQVLYLDDNNIGDRGAEFLSQNRTIQELYLSKNNITDVGAMHFAQNTTLKVLTLHENNIGKEGAAAVIQSRITQVTLSPIPRKISTQFINCMMRKSNRDPQYGNLLSTD